jgi:hypothetical protein
MRLSVVGRNFLYYRCSLWIVNGFSGERIFFENQTPCACHSEAGFIGEESAFLPASKQQIPRAITPRFGMTIPLGLPNYTTEFPLASVAHGPRMYTAVKLAERFSQDRHKKIAAKGADTT